MWTQTMFLAYEHHRQFEEAEELSILAQAKVTM